MGNRQYTNDASAVLAGTINSGSTTIAVATGFGALFPSPSGTEYFIVAIQDTSGNTEYVAITARSSDNLTVAPVSSQFPSGGRGQEGTTAQSFTANLARVEIRLTAAQQAGLYEKDGDTLTGPMNLGGQTVTNGMLGTGVSLEACTEIVNTPHPRQDWRHRQPDHRPDGWRLARAGGRPSDPLPGRSIAGFHGRHDHDVQRCTVEPARGLGRLRRHGTQNGYTKPDLRNAFIVGAGLAYALGANGDIAIDTSSVSAGTALDQFSDDRDDQSPRARASVRLLLRYAAAVIGVPGFSQVGGYYITGGTPGGSRVSFAGTSTGSGTAFRSPRRRFPSTRTRSKSDRSTRCTLRSM